MTLLRLLALAAIGSAAFCAVVAGIGWAVGSSWHAASHDLRYADYVVVAGLVLLGAYLVVRRRRAATISRGRVDSAR
jgi:membrane protein DedA with SNARE-associated domain